MDDSGVVLIAFWVVVVNPLVGYAIGERKGNVATEVCNCSGVHEFVTGKNRGNTFYKFAEDVRHNAIIRGIGGKNIQEAAAKLYDEPRRCALSPFETFADEVLRQIAEELDLKIEETHVAEPPDHKSLRPFLLFHE